MYLRTRRMYVTKNNLGTNRLATAILSLDKENAIEMWPYESVDKLKEHSFG